MRSAFSWRTFRKQLCSCSPSRAILTSPRLCCDRTDSSSFLYCSCASSWACLRFSISWQSSRSARRECFGDASSSSSFLWSQRCCLRTRTASLWRSDSARNRLLLYLRACSSSPFSNSSASLFFCCSACQNLIIQAFSRLTSLCCSGECSDLKRGELRGSTNEGSLRLILEGDGSLRGNYWGRAAIARSPLVIQVAILASRPLSSADMGWLGRTWGDSMRQQYYGDLQQAKEQQSISFAITFATNQHMFGQDEYVWLYHLVRMSMTKALPAGAVTSSLQSLIFTWNSSRVSYFSSFLHTRQLNSGMAKSFSMGICTEKPVQAQAFWLLLRAVVISNINFHVSPRYSGDTSAKSRRLLRPSYQRALGSNLRALGKGRTLVWKLFKGLPTQVSQLQSFQRTTLFPSTKLLSHIQ